MVAHGANLRGLGADDDVAAVGALPDAVAVAGEDYALFDVGKELTIALLVLFLDGAYHLELCGNRVEAFLAGFFCHAGIHIGPLEVLAGSGVLQVLYSAGDFAAMQVFEPDLGVFLFIGSGLLEDLGDLHIAVLLGLGGVVGVLVTGLGLAGEGFQEVLFGFGSFEVHINRV